MLETGRMQDDGWHLRESYLFDRNVIAEIHRAAREGIYDIRGFGAKRRLPHFDDLLFLGASIDDVKPEEFRRYGSARRLYNFKVDNADAY